VLKSPRLRPHLRFVPVDSETIWLASELEDRHLKGAAFRAVLPLCDGVHSTDQIVDVLSDRFEPANIYFSIIRLEALGLIEEAGAGPASLAQMFYDLLDPLDVFKVPAGSPKSRGLPLLPAVREGCVDGKSVARPLAVRLMSVGGADVKELAARLDRSSLLEFRGENSVDAFDPDLLTIVVTPDYLEPELEVLNRRALSAKAPWLLLKAAGVIPWLGPLFLPGRTACMECLLDRLRGHRRIESWHMAQTNAASSLRRSCAATPHSLDVACGLLGTELEKLALGRPSMLAGQVVTVDLREPRITEHSVCLRPQCPACGKPGPGRSAGRLPKDPLLLTRRAKSGHRDGGERIREASATNALLETHVSPITGAIGWTQSIEIGSGYFGHYCLCSWPSSSRETPPDLSNTRAAPAGISMGKGRTEAQARASGIGEALERLSVEWRGDEPGVCARASELSEPFIHPQRLLGYSQSQYRDRAQWREKNWTSYVPLPFDESAPIDWSPAWSLTEGRWKWVPTSYMFFNNRKISGNNFFRGDTNGVAAGNCLEEAVAQAFCELVERDATAVWWYNRLRRPGVDLESFGSRFVDDLVRAIRSQDFEVNAIDLTHDLGIPVFAATSHHPSKGLEHTLIGLGAHSDPRIALERAITELGQSWQVNEHSEMSKIFERSGLQTADELTYLTPDPTVPLRRRHDFSYAPTDDFLEDIERWVQLLRAKGLEILIADMTRPDIGLRVARVIVPGFAHFWPRFACTRLYEVPVRTGWLDQPREESELNPAPFLF